MPIIIPKKLPANQILSDENIFVMNKERAEHQDIRAMQIVILNLMPTKVETETQLIRLIGNTSLQVSVTLLKTKSYDSKNTSVEHLKSFYKTFDEIKDQNFDGMIITGAPVENMTFEDVAYWEELEEIMAFSKTHVTSTFHICWGAQAGLYYHYGIGKHPVPKKVFGVFEHTRLSSTSSLLRGFDSRFYVPHSRHTENKLSDIEGCLELEVLATSEEAGFYLAATKDLRQVFATGHSEYSEETLGKEYFRDFNKGLDIDVPQNYFVDDDSQKGINVMWRGHGHLLFSNWINYCVYQNTPFKLI